MSATTMEHDVSKQEVEDPDDASGASSDHDVNYAASVPSLPVYQHAE